MKTVIVAYNASGIKYYICKKDNNSDLYLSTIQDEALIIGSKATLEKYESITQIKFGDKYQIEIEEIN